LVLTKKATLSDLSIGSGTDGETGHTPLIETTSLRLAATWEMLTEPLLLRGEIVEK
jgi:hypothetical protein